MVSTSWFDITCVCVTQGGPAGCCERSRLFCLEGTRASHGESRWAAVRRRVSADVCHSDAAARDVYRIDSQRRLAAVSTSRCLVTTLSSPVYIDVALVHDFSNRFPLTLCQIACSL